MGYVGGMRDFERVGCTAAAKSRVICRDIKVNEEEEVE